MAIKTSNSGGGKTLSHLEPKEGEVYFDLFGMLRRKFGLILLFTLLGILLAVFCNFKIAPVYESTASLFVDEPTINTVSTDDDRRSQLRADAGTEKYIEVLGSDRIIGPAIERCGIENLKSLDDAEDDDLLEFVKDNLTVKSSDKKSESGVISLTLRSTLQDDARDLLNAIVEEFKLFIGDDSAKKGVQNVNTIAHLRSENKLELQQVEIEINELTIQPFILAVDGKVINQYQDQLVKIQDELHLNESERVRLESLTQKIKDAKRLGQPIEGLVLGSLDQVDETRFQPYAETQREFVRLSMEEQEMLEVLGEGHAKRKRIRKQIEILEQMKRNQLLTLFGSSVGDSEGNVDFYSKVVSHIDNKISFLDFHREKLNDAIVMAKKKSVGIQKNCERLGYLLSQREALQQSSLKMMDHSIELGVLSDARRREVELINFPTDAEQVFPSLLIFLPLGTILGFSLGFAISFLKEFLEQTFRSPEEISRHLGLPVLAEIAQFKSRRLKKSDFKTVDASVISLHLPQSVPAEVFRALRTKIFFNSLEDSSKVVQITSPLPGAGKSTISANLAISIANAGRTVVLVDCDLRKPTQTKIFGLDENHPGVTSILVGEAEITDCIQSIGVKNFRVIGCGTRYSNPAELLNNHRFPEFIELLRRKFDFVILDTPPVLPVVDPQIVSNYVDSIFLGVRIRKGVQKASAKALAELERVSDKIRGVVVNGISRRDAKSYQYGHSGYRGYGAKVYGSGTAYGDGKEINAPAGSLNGARGVNGEKNGSARPGQHSIPSP